MPRSPVCINGREPDHIVGDKICKWDWKHVFSLGTSSSTHINLLELRALLLYIKRRARAGPSTHGERILVLCDSRVCVGAIGKGRSSSPALNAGLRRLLAYSVASHLYVCVIWLPTGANPGDAPSRNVPVAVWLRGARAAAALRQRQRGARRDKSSRIPSVTSLADCCP